MYISTLLINEDGRPDDFNMKLCFDNELTTHRVMAIYPNTLYAKMVLTKQANENFRFIVVDAKRAFDKSSISKELAARFPKIQVITIGVNYKKKGTLDNLHSIENLEMAARFIADHPDSKE